MPRKKVCQSKLLGAWLQKARPFFMSGKISNSVLQVSAGIRFVDYLLNPLFVADTLVQQLKPCYA